MRLSTSNYLRLIELDAGPGWIESEIYSRLHQNASDIGPCTAVMAKTKWASSICEAHSDILSFLRLARRIYPERFEASCQRLLFYGFDSIDMVKTVLAQRLDRLPLDPKTDLYGQPGCF